MTMLLLVIDGIANDTPFQFKTSHENDGHHRIHDYGHGYRDDRWGL